MCVFSVWQFVTKEKCNPMAEKSRLFEVWQKQPSHAVTETVYIPVHLPLKHCSLEVAGFACMLETCKN